MRIVKPSYEIRKLHQEDILAIEEAARTCYKSENVMKEGSADQIISTLLANGHESAIEHAGMSVKFIIDRGISHELVRHRLASYSQESTRYCNYSKNKFGNEITVIEPCFYADIPDEEKELCRKVIDDPAAYKDDRIADFLERVTNIHKRYARWYEDCRYAERGYFQLLELGATPQEARNVLPTSLKTEVYMTANFREWRQIFKLRTAPDAHPQIREVMIPLLKEMEARIPILFSDISRNLQTV